MKGFKPTGNGPKKGFSFSSKAGFSGSTGRTQQVRGYTRAVPKRAPKFATGGVVGGTDGGSALTRRSQPVTQADKVAGGKTPLRPGFSKGGLGKRMGSVVGRAVQGARAPQGGLAAVPSRMVGRAAPRFGGFNRNPFIRG